MCCAQTAAPDGTKNIVGECVHGFSAAISALCVQAPEENEADRSETPRHRSCNAQRGTYPLEARKTSFRRLQNPSRQGPGAPRRGKMHPRGARKRPRDAQERPRGAQDTPKRRPRAPKRRPRAPERDPEAAQEAPKPLENRARSAPRRVLGLIFAPNWVRQAP